MAKSRYEYVKQFEMQSALLPETWVVVRVDGKGFTKFTAEHGYEKPNDIRGLSLMTACAIEVVKSIPGFILAYGQSDEYSFVLHKASQLYNRRGEKIISTVVSQFSSAFVYLWPRFFPETRLLRPPGFDSRAVLYPNEDILMDYLRWRQTDCHINNLYNTCFWRLVSTGLTEAESHQKLKGTSSGEKNELLYQQFQVNYNEEPEMYRKGTTLIRPDWTPVFADLFPQEFYTENHVFEISFPVPKSALQSAFSRFADERKPTISYESPGLTERDVMQVISAEWKALSPASKLAYEQT
jgi:tRNA(His) guanylyltransferase